MGFKIHVGPTCIRVVANIFCNQIDIYPHTVLHEEEKLGSWDI